jgi:hypothetical protein
MSGRDPLKLPTDFLGLTCIFRTARRIGHSNRLDTSVLVKPTWWGLVREPALAMLILACAYTSYPFDAIYASYNAGNIPMAAGA